MKANLINRTIEMTKNEAKTAGRITSDTYKELRQYQEAYPNFTIAIVATPKRKSQYKGLDYNFMEKYIEKCNKEDKEIIMNDFNTLRGKDENTESASYLDVRDWFLKKFPEIKAEKEEQRKKIETILKSVA